MGNKTTFTAGGICNPDDVVIYGTLRIWAERGLIRIEDGRDGSYNVISVREMLYRLNAHSDMLINGERRRQKNTHDRFDERKRHEIQTMLENCLRVCRKAKEQGMPSDASARRDLVRRRPKTLVVPGLRSEM